MINLRATALLVMMLSLLSACAPSVQLTAADRPAMGASASAAVGGGLNETAAHMILVTIANDSALSVTEPGSTPRGYDAIGSYAVSDQAKAVGDALGRDYGLQQVRAWPIAQLGVQCLVFALPPQADRSAMLSRLAADRRVRLAQPLQLFNSLAAQAADASQPEPVVPATFSGAKPGITGYNDPYIGLQQGFAAIDAGAAQRWSRGEGVRVAIIDTGVEVSHPDLAGRVEATRNFIDSDMQSFEADRHGTSVAGVIGADANNNVGIVGVAPAARLQIYKACQPLQPNSLEAQCNSFTLALALDAAIAAHAQIVNLSLGGPSDPLLTQLVRNGQRRGIVFVGAVPRDGRLDGFPIGIAGVIAVDQVGRSDGSATVLHAPGSDILSLAPAGRYDFATGSSFAAAHVTGAIALLRARAPALDASALFALLQRTRTRDDQGERINACAALAAVEPHDDCSQSTKAVATATVMH
jgi:Subtilase family